ncbi:Trk family potassium uptake protein [Candidatus Aerophobetes bacterium]|nr:Trk family potassium uptake protein [Candidatus Aerophobetes bacterium]
MFAVIKIPHFYRWLSSLHIPPPLTVVVTFLIIIATGTFLLILPHATAPGKETKFIDALFTAASATCVTGLIVVDTGSHFSLFGQIVILSLIQIGGLGLMMFASLFALISRDFGVRERILIREVTRYENLSKISSVVLLVLFLTLLFEAGGAIFLYFQLLSFEKSALHAAYSAIFHSISAFCNAGFSLYSDSFMRYRADFGVNIIMAGLIISGGLGFVVVLDLLGGVKALFKKQRKYFSLHARLVLFTTLILIIAGTFIIFAGEQNGLFKGFSLKEKFLASFFQAVTARTAGFNTVKISSLTSFTCFFLILLMFIGASPGSTGGGIKTSTFALLLLTIRSMIQGKDEVEVFKRTVPRTTIYQALCVITLALCWISLSTLLLSFTEKSNFLDIFFEVFSAFGTVGLSRGITSELTTWGKIIIIVTVIAGRIGPLTLALAIAGKKKVKRYRYPEENIIIG